VPSRNEAEIVVRPVRDEGERTAALDLRRRVFGLEQGVSEADELDGRDRDALHLIALCGEELVGTCRLLCDSDAVRLGRMAVDAGRRRRGVGAALLRAAEGEACRAGAERVALAAQRHAEGFYAAHGYEPRGAPFQEAGIAHVRMEKRLA
jgi:ElaA protein